MSVMTSKKPATATAIRPFTVDVPEDELVELRRRLAATRWPDKETVSDRSRGVQLANLIYRNEFDNGRHFADWEQPQLFTEEVRAAFASLR